MAETTRLNTTVIPACLEPKDGRIVGWLVEVFLAREMNHQADQGKIWTRVSPIYKP